MRRKVFAGIQDKIPEKIEALNVWRNLMRAKQKYDTGVFDVCDEWLIFSRFESWFMSSHGEVIAHIGHVSEPIFHSEKTSVLTDKNLAKFLSDRNTKDYSKYSGISLRSRGEKNPDVMYTIHRPSDGLVVNGTRNYNPESGESEISVVMSVMQSMYRRKRLMAINHLNYMNDYDQSVKFMIRTRYEGVVVNPDFTISKKT